MSDVGTGKQMSPRGARLFGMGFAGFACIFMLVGVGLARAQAAKLAGWPSVIATVGGGEVKVERDSDGDTYAPLVHFTYRVDGVEHTAHTPFPLETSGGSAWAHAAAARFAPGQQVTAWYNPAAPDEAYLIREADFFPYLFILFPMLHVCAGLAVWWFAGSPGLTPLGKARRLLGITAIWSAVGILAGAHFASVGGVFDALALGAFAGYGALAFCLFLGWTRLARRALLAAPTDPAPATMPPEPGNPYQQRD
jgi:hypothetical protein